METNSRVTLAKGEDLNIYILLGEYCMKCDFCKRNNFWKNKEERTSETARIIMGPQGWSKG